MSSTRYSLRTLRFRHTVQCLNAFVQDAQANTDSDPDVLFQDAYDKYLASLDIDEDFPAVAVPVWMAFKARYVSDMTGGLVAPGPDEDVSELVREAIQLAQDVRELVESETASFEDRDRDAYLDTARVPRSRFSFG